MDFDQHFLKALAQLKTDLRAYAESEVPPNPDLGVSPALPPKLQARQDQLFKTRMEYIAAEEAKKNPALMAQVVRSWLNG